jgi:hypothetical protein
MTSAHRYPPPPPSSQNDFRLPSLKDLNFYRPSGAQPAPQQQDPASTQPEQPPQPSRHPAAWSRSAYQPPQPPAPATHQQYTQPSHEVVPKVEYPPKHENTGYAHPGLPLSVQTNSAPSSATMPPTRSDGASHSPNQQKRQRTAPASRDTRKSHVPYFLHSSKLRTDNLTCSLLAIPILNILRVHNHLQASTIQVLQACLPRPLMPHIRRPRPMSKYTTPLTLCR